MPDIEELIEKGKKAREKAYAPYSGFKVGCALLTGGGRTYTGCNVENASYGLTICAERTAIFKAVSEGETDFRRLAVVADSSTPPSPCGACRQVIWEFSQDAEIVMANLQGEIEVKTIEDLIPMGFDLEEEEKG